MPPARSPKPLTKAIDSHCQMYQGLFNNVKSFEHLKYIHFGLLTQGARKSLLLLPKFVVFQMHKDSIIVLIMLLGMLPIFAKFVCNVSFQL